MAIHFDAGEVKWRPGVFQRHTNVGGAPVAGVINGIAAFVANTNWGELGKVITIEQQEDIQKLIGTESAENTTALVKELFIGGAKKVEFVRLGNGGTSATLDLNDTTEGTPLKALQLFTKYPTTRGFVITIRPKLGDDTLKEFIVYEDGNQLEKIEFAAGSGEEVDKLLEALKQSAFFMAQKTKDYAGTGDLALLSSAPLTAGEAPKITNQDYSNAFVLLEAYDWNCIAIDSEANDLQKLLDQYMTRAFNDGKMAFCCIGLPTSMDFEDRLTKAKAYNNKLTVCVIGTWDEDEMKYDGAKAAARIAGMIAQVPSENSLTRALIKGATGCSELLTNSQYERAIQSGALLFSLSADGNVWIEQAITTFTVFNETDDLGWSKIKRGKIRFELMDRASRTADPLVARVRNNSDGRATVLNAWQRLLDSMVAEQKLEQGAKVFEDPDNPAQGDSAWFVFEVDDIDSLEKMYIHYKFRFSSVLQ